MVCTKCTQNYTGDRMNPRIDVYCVMRNEIKILPYFLRHYENIAQRIFVWDDHSDDGTFELLQEHRKVTLLPFPEDAQRGMADPYWIKELWPRYKELSRGCVDWVIIVDADELVYHPQFFTALRDYKEKGFNTFVCHSYIMVSRSFLSTTGQAYDEVKHGLRDGRCDKWVLFSPDVDMEFMVGRNRRPLKYDGAVICRDPSFKLLHYRNLGMDYLRERNRKNVKSLGVDDNYFNRPCTLPNSRRRGNVYAWFERNIDKAERIVD
jgi:hypothetical protein